MEIVLKNGAKRFLGCLPPKADFGGLKKFRAANPLVPRSEWKVVNRRSLFPATIGNWVLNQGQVGSCVGNASTNALRKARLLSGQKDVALSPGCTYAQINGGVDQGAVISDSLTALTQTGTCEYALVGESPYYLDQLPDGWQQEAARFRIAEAYHCESFDEIGSALQLGYLVIYGIQVGNNFEDFDPNGVAGYSRGPGNHCMHADGMQKLPNGSWVLDDVNSWGADWGPWGNGRVFLCEDHFLHGDQPDAYAIQAPITDPQGKVLPPGLSAFGIHRSTARTHQRRRNAKDFAGNASGARIKRSRK